MIKFQITNSKSQINSNDQNSPASARSRDRDNDRNSFGHWIIGIWILFVIWCLEFGILIQNVSADTVYLTSGKTVKGLVVEEHHDRIVFSTYQGEVQIPKISIDQIFFDAEEQNYLYLGDEALEQGNLDLAFGFYQRAYQINSGLERTRWAFLRLLDEKNRRRLNIQPQAAIDKLNKQLGISIERFKDKIKITSVASKPLAEITGVCVGDFIINVWDASIMYMDAQSAAEILVSAPNTPVSLTIEKHIILPAKNTPMFRNIFYIAQFINFGIKLSLRPSGLLVTYVKPQGEAQKSGLRLMDEITYINQESVRYMPVSLVRKKIFQSKLDEVVLTVRRQIILTRRE